jgi:alpha-tubulin suppressor-like RCC1 family protein
MSRRAPIAVLALLVVGCYQTPSDFAPCTITCTDSCPGELACTDGMCVAPGSSCGSGTDTMPGNVATFGVGAYGACAQTTAGAIACWGANGEGQLGTGATAGTIATAPMTVDADGSAWSSLAVGPDHACAIRGGHLLCWGNNTDGEVAGTHGGIDAAPTVVPVVPPATTQFTQVVAGAQASCAIGTPAFAGTNVACWGAADRLGFTGDVFAATPIASTAMFLSLSAGTHHTCGITGDHGIQCWGHTGDGELTGSVGATDPMGPTDVPLPTDRVAIAVAAGQLRTCAILSADPAATQGELWCWGNNSQFLVPGGPDPLPVTQLGADEDWTAIALGARFACGIRGGHAHCWGSSAFSIFGDGAWDHAMAIPFASAVDLGPADAVAAGMDPNGGTADELTCVASNGHLACFGDDQRGELANGGVTFEGPTAVTAPPGAGAWTGAWIGELHTCARTDAGTLFCWGADDEGQVTGADAPRGSSTHPCVPGAPCDAVAITQAPASAAVGSGAHDVLAGADSTCVLEPRATGAAIECWGSPASIGGDAAHGASAITAPTGGWAAIAGGKQGTCAFDAGGAATCWGVIGSLTVNPPQANATASGLTAFASGTAATCGLDGARERVCWGTNTHGELGTGGADANGIETVHLDATDAAYTALAIAQSDACGIAADGGVRCWGTGYFGESGSGAIGVPTAITSDGATPLAACTTIDVSGRVSCALCDAPAVPRCWGDQTHGALARPAGDYDPVSWGEPVAVTQDMWTMIAAGAMHACALAADHTLVCWGTGVRGQLGNGVAGANVPIEIPIP